ncbi:MAG: glycosyltransferase, partial [Phycisphaerae bacterium]|nr:glycosyltransferase [Phycisphaerae bacterium]
MKFSIVMPSYNQAPFLAQSLRSVLDQEGNFELQLIVVDGGSTDGSIGILESVDDERVEWTSERDEGQANAINKGMGRAHGDVVAWLNSDDAYPPGALQAVADAFSSESDPDWVVGRCEIVDQNDRVIRRAITRY